MLEARNSDGHADIVCSAGVGRGGRTGADSRATHLCGSRVFSAVFFENGVAFVYTPAGRRAVPPARLPRPSRRVPCARTRRARRRHRRLLIVIADLTPGEERQIMRESVAPLLAGPRAPPAPQMTGVRLARCGSPVRAIRRRARVRVPSEAEALGARRGPDPRSEFTSGCLPRTGGPGTAASSTRCRWRWRARRLGQRRRAPARDGRHLERARGGGDARVAQRTWLRAYVRHLAQARRTGRHLGVPVRGDASSGRCRGAGSGRRGGRGGPGAGAAPRAVRETRSWRKARGGLEETRAPAQGRSPRTARRRGSWGRSTSSSTPRRRVRERTAPNDE